MLIADPKKFSDDLGNLHDAWIKTVDYSASGQTLELGIDDLNAAFRNWVPSETPEPEERPSRLLLTGVTDLQFGTVTDTGLRISALEIEPCGPSSKLIIALSDGGIPSIAEKWWITAVFTSMYLLEPNS